LDTPSCICLSDTLPPRREPQPAGWVYCNVATWQNGCVRCGQSWCCAGFVVNPGVSINTPQSRALQPPLTPSTCQRHPPPGPQQKASTRRQRGGQDATTPANSSSGRAEAKWHQLQSRHSCALPSPSTTTLSWHGAATATILVVTRALPQHGEQQVSVGGGGGWVRGEGDGRKGGWGREGGEWVGCV
jgi:hypothetical protein